MSVAPRPPLVKSAEMPAGLDEQDALSHPRRLNRRRDAAGCPTVNDDVVRFVSAGKRREEEQPNAKQDDSQHGLMILAKECTRAMPRPTAAITRSAARKIWTQPIAQYAPLAQPLVLRGLKIWNSAQLLPITKEAATPARRD